MSNKLFNVFYTEKGFPNQKEICYLHKKPDDMPICDLTQQQAYDLAVFLSGLHPSNIYSIEEVQDAI